MHSEQLFKFLNSEQVTSREGAASSWLRVSVTVSPEIPPYSEMKVSEWHSSLLCYICKGMQRGLVHAQVGERISFFPGLWHTWLPKTKKE